MLSFHPLEAGVYGDRLSLQALCHMGHINKLFYFQVALSHFWAWVVPELPRPLPAQVLTMLMGEPMCVCVVFFPILSAWG